MQGNSTVSWRDYSGEGFGAASIEDVNNLNKALTAGSAQNAPGSATAGDGFAMRVESLEQTLKNTTFRMEHVRLWKGIPKVAAMNTVEEYNQVQEYGQAGMGAFLSEGTLPSETDATYERKYAQVKFLGTTRKVSHVMSLVKPAHGNMIAQETVNGTMYLLRQLERSLFTGDSAIDALEFDGFDKLITDGAPANHVIDLRGQPLTEDNLVDGALTVMDAPAFGQPTHLHLNPTAKADLTKSFFPKARYDVFGKDSDGLVGLDMRGFTSPAGDIRFEPNVFIDDGGVKEAAAAGSGLSTIPIAPTLGTLISVTSAASLWVVADQGAYSYVVTAHSASGRSIASAALAVDTSSALTGQGAVGAGESVRFTITDAGTGTATAAAYYSIHRKDPGQSDHRFIQKLKVAAPAHASTTLFTDDNLNLPATTKAFMFQQDLSNMSFKQLAPMVKIPLATIDSSIRWMQLLYGVPVLYTPRHNVMFKNIGRAT